MDDAEEARTPMKRLGSTRKLQLYNNVRAQLSEQLKCLEVRVEAQTSLAAELQEYFRRRAELEADYSRGLDKLARSVRQRHKGEEWCGLSGAACWERVVRDTAALGRDHAALADLFGSQVTRRLAAAGEDAARLHRRCRELAGEAHEDLLRVLADLHRAMKAHAAHAHECRLAADKLRHAARARAQAFAHNKKLKPLDKELHKRRGKHAEAKLRALRARAEYVLCLEAANATMHKYFVDDLSDIIDCMDMGYHACVSRALRMHAAADEGRAAALQQHARLLHGCAESVDAQLDKQRFLEAHQQAFMMPRKLQCEGAHEGDEPEPEPEPEAEAEAAARGELAARLGETEARIRELHAQVAETAKTLEESERSLRAAVETEDWDVRNLFGGAEPDADTPPTTPAITTPSTPVSPPHLTAQRRDTEEFYITKLRDYLATGSQLARLESAAAALHGLLGAAPPAPRARPRRAAPPRPGVFAASLETHLAAARRDLPLVLVSCCRVIQLYGLRHQGIFRVSGSQVDINSLRAEFERGEDPLARVADASDMNSVAGLLKLYLRELRPPLIPLLFRARLLALARLPPNQFIPRMREFVLALPHANMLTLRYLFAFLAHLAEYSEENMMDEWNLAICLGPTLLPVSEERDQVLTQNTLNELVKQLIVQHAHVFPQTPPALYRRLAPPRAPHRAASRLTRLSAEAEGTPDDPVEATTTAAQFSAETAPESAPEASTDAALPLPALAEPALADPALGPTHEESEAPPGVWTGTGTSSQESPASSPLAENLPTPDLVQDLPPGGASPASPAPHSAADTFLNNRDTLKKKPHPHRAGAGEGSPVPPHNTQRVAARFAELTLTGGSAPPAAPARSPTQPT